MALFLHISNTLWIICFVVRDVLVLRLLAITAIVVALPYYFCRNYLVNASTASDSIGLGTNLPSSDLIEAAQETIYRGPEWVPIGWQTVFLLINIIWVVKIWRERQPPRMSADERKLYEFTFRGSCSPRELLHLLTVAKWQIASPGDRLATRGTRSDQLSVIVNGRVALRADDRVVSELRDGDVVGEISYLTGDAAATDAVAIDPVRYVVWHRTDLDSLFEKRPELKSAIQGIIGYNLVERLKSATPRVPELSLHL